LIHQLFKLGLAWSLSSNFKPSLPEHFMRERIDEAAKDPAQLIQLFKEVTHQKERTSAEGEIFEKIKSLDSEKKLSETQVKDIIKVACEIYPKTEGNQKLEYLHFAEHHIAPAEINASNVFSYLKYAKRLESNESISKCLAFIQRDTGAKLKVSDSSLHIDLSDSEKSLEELSQVIDSLSKIFGDKIEITQQFKNHSLPDIQKFLEHHGNSICSLGLRRFNNEINEIISNLENLKSININNNYDITELKNLPKNLETLELIGCGNLTTLPDELPKSLKKLRIRSCESLETLPEKLPESFEELEIGSFCQNLKTLPKILPESLKTLSITSCHKIKTLPELPENLEKLELVGCVNIELPKNLPNELKELILPASGSSASLPDKLPEGLKKLDLSGSFVQTLPVLPKSLKELYLRNCNSLTMLPIIPNNLKILDLSKLGGLGELPNLPNSLEELNLHDSTNLKRLPSELPWHLKKLNLSRCRSLEQLPITFPADLENLDLGECKSLSDQSRESAFIRNLREHGLEYALKLEPQLQIQNQNKVFQRIAETLNNDEFLEEGEDPRKALLDALENKLSDIEDPDNLFIAQYIENSRGKLGLHDEHPLMQQSIEIISIHSVEGEKNPFSLIRKLRDLAKTPSKFTPPSMEIDGTSLRIDMTGLKAMAQGTVVKREDLPKNVNRAAFENLINNLSEKVRNDPEGAKKAFEPLGLTWRAFSAALNDPEQHLARMLDLSGEEVSDSEAKWRAVLSSILDKKTDGRPGEWFTEQEESFVLNMMGIYNCSGGKNLGIAQTYETLELKYKYPVVMSVPMSVEEIEAGAQKRESIDFFKKFIEDNPGKTSDEMPKALADYVNEKDHRKERGEKFNPLIQDISWEEDEHYKFDENDIDILITEKGALSLLEAVERDTNFEPVKELIAQALKKVITDQFSGANELMKELTGTSNFSQGVHQAIYLKNLIGALVGITNEITFDRYTGTLNDNLLNRDRDEVLKIFFKYITPKSFVSALERVVNEQPEENRKLLKAFLSNESWDEKGTLNQKGALELLEQFHFLKKN